MKLKISGRFLADMKLWKKFMLLGLLVLPMVGLPTYYYAQKTWADFSNTTREINGLKTTSAVIELLGHAQQHGARSMAFLGDPAADTADIEKLQGQIKGLIERLEQEGGATGDGRIQGAVLDIKSKWQSLSELVKARSMESDAAFSDHNEFGRQILYLNELFLDFFRLSLDPDEHTAMLIKTVYVDLPAATEPISKIQALGVSQLIRAEARRKDPKAAGVQMTAAERVTFATYLTDAQGRIEQAGRGLAKVTTLSPSVKNAMDITSGAKLRAADRLIEMAKSEVLDVAEPSFPPAEFMEKMSSGIEAYYVVIGDAARILESELVAKVNRLKQTAIYTGIELLGFFMIGGILGFFIIRNVTATVHALQVAVDKVRSGDETGLANIRGKDEIGSLGRTVNILLQERIAAQNKAEEENAQLNKSVIELMQTVYQLSNRDLTAHANVDESVIGTVASSINQFTGETGKVLGQVSRIAGNVDRASAQVKAQAERVQQTAQSEMAEVSSMVSDISEAVTQMSLIAKLAGNTNDAAESASQATNAALDRVRETVAGMEGIRETIAETEKRIKRLGERSQEISGIVNLINTIAERTHVLALNAAMQAAIAGDAGRGFAVVAEEVQRLAESSRNATSQIATLINNIQIETNETIGTVNRTISQVVGGSELAKRAGEQMQETQRIANNLAGLVQQIASGTEAQNQIAVELRNRISEIGRSTEQTSRQIEEQAGETAALAEAARQLNSAISVFKLPRQMLESDTAAHSAVSRVAVPAAA